MDDKRTFLAIALAIAVLLAWTPLAEHMGWIQPQQRPAATQEATPAPAPAAQTAVAPASSLPVFTPSAGTDVKVETPLYSAVIYSGGGILRSFTLKHYDETIKADSPKVNLISPEASQTAPLGLTVNGQPSWSTGQWSFQGSDLNLKAGEQGSLTFTGIVDGVRVTRVISFNADNYLLSENILVGSADQAPRTVRLGFTVAATPFSNGKYDPTRLAWDANESFKEETSASTLAEKGIIEQGVFNWAGVMSNYFMNVTAPADPNNLTLKGRVQGDVWRLALERPDRSWTTTVPTGRCCGRCSGGGGMPRMRPTTGIPPWRKSRSGLTTPCFRMCAWPAWTAFRPSGKFYIITPRFRSWS